MRSERGRNGQIILLAGILIAMAYILFSVQIALVANLGQQAGRETRNVVLEDYLIIRQSFRSAILGELRDADGEAICPTDATEFEGRVETILQTTGLHEQNRGQSFVAAIEDLDLGTPNEVHVEISLLLTDGDATVQDHLWYSIPCKPAP